MTHRVDDIEAAFLLVKASAKKVADGDETSKDQSFQDIFALNNEIGRLARESPEARPRMKELQAYVNMITVGIKYGKFESLRQGLVVTEESISAMKKNPDKTP
jgi:hypothetical protein